jgi:hypothetical protein
MDKCFTCECSATELWELLENIDDLAILHELACDMAERVADLTPDPAQAKAWIAAARLGQLAQTQVNEALSVWEKARSAWEQAKEAWGAHHPLEQLESASRAVTFITPNAEALAERGELEGARSSLGSRCG